MEKLSKREKVMMALGLVGGAVIGVTVYNKRGLISSLMLSKLENEEAILGLLHITDDLSKRVRILEEEVMDILQIIKEEA